MQKIKFLSKFRFLVKMVTFPLPDWVKPTKNLSKVPVLSKIFQIKANLTATTNQVVGMNL
jgi:hypothetical protein